ncbi:VanZ family protein [Thalassotalea aquiviva]|uniref:VanZ family protein n=1 Tax=Thalassotalea aquiviva TaxID=3242415 RepID=UPI00352AA979
MKLVAVIFFTLLCSVLVDADLGKQNAIFTLKDSIPFGDKVGHFLMYGVLALLANFAFKFRFIWQNQTYQLGSLLVLIFSLSEEFSQLLFATRTFSVADIMANVVGITFFTWLSLQCGKQIPRYNTRLV